MKNSVFISFEGPEGAGKTTVIKELEKRLDLQFADQLVVTREPGGNPIAESIRNILQPKEENGLDKRTEALLYAAARRQHIVENIKPSLIEGKIVLSDRYIDSSLAYQGGGRELGVSNIMSINDFATEGLMPDLTLYLDLPVEIGLARINRERKDKLDRLDKETVDFHQKTRDTYLQLAKKYHNRIQLVDATQEIMSVVDVVENAIIQTVTRLRK